MLSRKAAVVTTAVGVVLLALAGCIAPAAPTPTPSPAVDVAGPEPDGSSLDLIGLWRVTEAAGAAPETWLAVHDGFLTIWTPCSAVGGSWVSDGARLRAAVSSGFGPCVDPALAVGPWFAAITGFERTGAETIRLLDSTGETVAVLTADAAPGPFDFGENGMREVTVPSVTEEARTADAEPTALDPELVPIDDATVAGRWELADYEGRGDPHVDFRGDGIYVATDGCNGAGGPYLINADGRIRAGGGGGGTQVGCDNVDLPLWVATAARAGIDRESDELVLLSRDGAELARLER